MAAGTLVDVPSTLPDGDPAPASGELPDSALPGLGERPFGFYVHVPFCVTRCGYCDFNTYTATELGPGASQRDYADTAIEEVRLAAPGPRRGGSSGRDGVLRWRHPHAAAGRGPVQNSGGHRRGVRAQGRRGGDDGGEPRVRRPALPGRTPRGRLQPGQLRHAERPRARAQGARPAAHAGPGRAGRAGGAQGRVRARQPGPDLQHAGGVRRRLASPRWRPPSPPSPTTSRPTR